MLQYFSCSSARAVRVVHDHMHGTLARSKLFFIINFAALFIALGWFDCVLRLIPLWSDLVYKDLLIVPSSSTYMNYIDIIIFFSRTIGLVVEVGLSKPRTRVPVPPMRASQRMFSAR